jgi:uncharacterized protein YbjT (DUF2867 family)
MSKILLITGATGNQGGAVIKALLTSAIPCPFKILALTRNTNALPAQTLLAKYPSINLIQGNLDDPQDIFSRAGGPIWGIFSVQNPMIQGSSNEIEERQAKDLMDAAIKHNVKHFVYSSVDRHGSRSDTNPTNVPHFANKHRVEKYLQEKAAAAGKGVMTWTILRPTGFMENFCTAPFGPAFMERFMGRVLASVWRYALPVDVPLQLISVIDIGWFGAQAFLHSDSKEYRNRAISLAADELTFEEASKICKDRLGYPLPVMPNIVAWGVLKFMGDIRLMFEFFAQERLHADIVDCRRLNPNMMNFGEWLETASDFVKI